MHLLELLQFCEVFTFVVNLSKTVDLSNRCRCLMMLQSSKCERYFINICSMNSFDVLYYYFTFNNSSCIYKKFSSVRVLFSSFQTSPMISSSPASIILNVKIVANGFPGNYCQIISFRFALKG